MSAATTTTVTGNNNNFTTGQYDHELKLIDKLRSMFKVDPDLVPVKSISYVKFPISYQAASLQELNKKLFREFGDMYMIEQPTDGRLWIGIRRIKRIELLYEGMIYILLGLILSFVYINYYEYIDFLLLMLK